MSASLGILPVVAAFFQTRPIASAAGFNVPLVRVRHEFYNFRISINSGDTLTA